MRLDSMRQMFIELAGAEPRGWVDLWDAFVAVIREPVDEPDILRDDIWVEIVPPHPYDSTRPYVLLSRKIGIRGEDPDFNLEARLAVTAVWTSVDDRWQAEYLPPEELD
jgi:hypothetical protein